MPHDWAPPLTTVGTLATELLAELFEDDEEEHEEQEPKTISQVLYLYININIYKYI